jgi:hypothetical protein
VPDPGVKIGDAVWTTVIDAWPLMLALLAVTVALPCDNAHANPLLVVLTTDELLDVQVTELVRSVVLESLKIPVAFNCRVAPMPIAAVLGVTLIVCNVGDDTVTPACPWMLPTLAMMFAVPGATAVARPAALIVVIDVKLEFQVAEEVQSAVELSEKLHVATNCWVASRGSVETEGVTVTAFTVGDLGAIGDGAVEAIAMLMLPVPVAGNVITPAASDVTEVGAPAPVTE